MDTDRDNRETDWGADLPPAGTAAFVTTHWSVVAAAAEGGGELAEKALAALCQAYWYPLYAYVRRQGNPPEEAQDLTQEFFAQLLARGAIARADPARGRFRTFLLSAMKHFLINDWRRRGRQKRGGPAVGVTFDEALAEERWLAESAGSIDPERLYERRWASALLEQALNRLRCDYAAGHRAAIFDSLKDYLWGARAEISYAEAGRALGMTETAIKVAIHRLRQRFRDILRAAIAETVSDPAEIDDELRHLIRVLAG